MMRSLQSTTLFVRWTRRSNELTRFVVRTGHLCSPPMFDCCIVFRSKRPATAMSSGPMSKKMLES
jgi:hypothetical protein